MEGSSQPVIIGIFIWDVMYREIEDLIDEVTFQVTIEETTKYFCVILKFRLKVDSMRFNVGKKKKREKKRREMSERKCIRD